MGVRTLLRYLLGGREAILQLARSPWTLPVGLLFVLSAALAREYDGQDLQHEPWQLLAPLGASLLTSLVLFLVAYGRPRHYPAFLGLFWLTAPLAWLYAVPYERFLAPVDAVRANLATLGLVSAWRVALMARVLVVLLGYAPGTAVFVVLAFADVTALGALCFLPFPLIDLMSGVRLTEGEVLVRNVAHVTAVLGGCTLPLWLFCGLVTRLTTRPRWQSPALAGGPAARPSLALWALAAGSVAVWCAVLPFTQPEQQLRYRVERSLREGQVRAALAEMSAHDPGDFPPGWSPPPGSGALLTWEGRLLIYDILEEIAVRPPAPWVREVYLKRLRDALGSRFWIREEELPRLGRLLWELPEGPELLAESERGEDWFLPEKLRPYVTGGTWEEHKSTSRTSE
jgi:hypothetical protein